MSSERSTPAQKALSPVAVTTTTRTSSMDRSARQVDRISARIRSLKACSTSGRSSVTRQTWSAISTLMVSNPSGSNDTL